MAKFVITGTLKNGKRFRPIHTDEPQNYNIYRGTVWFINSEGKRIKWYSIYN